MPHPHTQEQTDVLAALSQPVPPTCLIIKAGPGSGKTYIIARGIIECIPKREWSQVIALAFNKEIATKLVRDLPSTCKVATFNALGLAAWEAYIHPRACLLNKRKTRGILDAIADQGRWTISPEEIDDLLSLVSMAKNQGYAPARCGAKSVSGAPSFKQLCFLADIRPEPHYEALLDEILRRSIQASFQGDIDFDDQVYMTTLFVPTLPKVKWLFVDESQDLNGLQLALVKRLKATHTVLVGDPLQAIYAFRGAMSDSFDRIMGAWPDALVLPLNTSFRLPHAVLPLLREHNQGLTVPEDNPQGITSLVRGTSDLQAIFRDYFIEHVLTTRAILCRNNAPLFRAALACIASGVPFAMAHTGFGVGLIRDIRRMSRAHHSIDAAGLITGLSMLWLKEDATPSEKERVADKLAAVDAVASQCDTIHEVIQKIEGLLRQPNKSDKSPYVLLSTAHRAKGLEFDWVMHLDPDLIPSQWAKTPEELSQEANIAYVINSRTKHTLVFCSSSQILIPASTPRRVRPNTRQEQPL